MKIYNHIKTVLEQNEKFCKEGKLFKNVVVEAGLKLDPDLLSILLSDETAKKYFFTDVNSIAVFDKVKFQKFVSNKQFLPDSYTAFKNKIGLTANGEYLTQANEVVLDFPYKDCVLEGGQTKDDQKRQEIFWNETLAPDEIDRLFEPKVLTNWKHYDKDGEHEVKSISLDDNLIIKGNNLIALHSLKQVYKGKVKLIYIDPPYNTGNDSFNYNNSFNHSTWLTFMKNRLEVAKELLRDDGVIFISIDINEQAYLRVLCEEVFNRENFVGEIIWETATDNNATQISIEHEYILCCAKDKALLPRWEINSEKARFIIDKYNELKKEFGDNIELIESRLRNWINGNKKSNDFDLSGVSHYSYVDDKGVFYPGNSANTRPGGYTFDIIHPVTKKACKKPDNGYRWPESTFWEADKSGDVLWADDENGIPKIKKRIETASELLKGYFYEDNRKSTKVLTKTMGKKVFDNPKSINLLKKIIKFSTDDKDIVLDFFAGSGTTAHAVLEINSEDNGNRKFILCEQMDYINTVTTKRVQQVIKNKGVNNSFVFTELAKDNAEILESIQNAKDSKELITIWEEIKDKPFISYKINPKDINNHITDFESLNLDEQKKLLVALLDKNQLYVNLSEMESTDHSINETDKSINRKFYSIG